MEAFDRRSLLDDLTPGLRAAVMAVAEMRRALEYHADLVGGQVNCSMPAPHVSLATAIENAKTQEQLQDAIRATLDCLHGMMSTAMAHLHQAVQAMHREQARR